VTRDFDVIVAGGGLAGLAAACYVARAGRSVALFEKSRRLGGRAITTRRNGFYLNLGPHALYLTGKGRMVLDELGVSFSGSIPSVRQFAYAFNAGEKHILPIHPVSSSQSRLLPPSAAGEVLSLLQSPPLDARQLAGTSLSAFLAEKAKHPVARSYLRALFRLLTYSDIPEKQSAAAAMHQLQLGSGGTLYLDRGWQTLVDGFHSVAKSHGVLVIRGQEVLGIEAGREVDGIRTTKGFYSARNVVLAVPPLTVLALLGGLASAKYKRALQALIPVRAASLELGLSRLPDSNTRFVLGLDQPVYFSVHSAYARLAPAGATFVHVAKYLGESASRPKLDRLELEEFLDAVQPGWKAETLVQRFLPEMIASHALSTPENRPDCLVPGVRGAYVVGDWVGPEGMLLDAALGSAQRAVGMILQPQKLTNASELAEIKTSC
jgi:phytoene dehydrogenase-like protein